MERRTFLRNSILFSGGIALTGLGAVASPKGLSYVSNRPAKNKRNFVSSSVDEMIDQIKEKISNPELSWMFENCFPNTLDTTVQYSEESGKPDTFVITGDINAMWLRDSTAQVWPYLSLVPEDEKLKNLFKGLINRQTKCVLIDPYANAFNKGDEGSHWESDYTEMKAELHERKWEIDSLCYTIRLAYHYWKTSGDDSCFDAKWEEAAELIVKTFKEQQRKEDRGPYSFQRKTRKPYDTLPDGGYGNPVNPVGLIVSSFRPSDDATLLPFLIPSNYFAVVSLKQLAEIATYLGLQTKLAEETLKLANEVDEALAKYAVSDHLNYGNILAFEVDGFGNKLFMDDANIPSLLSLPYLGAMETTDSLYQNTRKFVLSANNPWFYKGKYAEGIGGPHVGADMIWPMSIVMRAMTSDDEQEIISCMQMLINTHAETGFMHETFHKNNPENFTRSWFAWANTLFGELIVKLFHERPTILEIV
ncbi:glycoside hydrolase family 125 protein [Labilibaculum sp. A4]|uniref:glycoside hydrolase family 125 protein n=1 Tax=Labilibaculum euxinus TaxID=2686357 RepID=UPI000F61E659|nr:glycoside hydrolase family 125 protein [Labilibaculum euxinus]MDQ1771412.1 glycoside hydrolase family 125 protein [Labilibaculum euxinus]MWN76700.1 glycoside hydrolase family 125 protein [Labilibaculum euxinus]